MPYSGLQEQIYSCAHSQTHRHRDTFKKNKIITFLKSTIQSWMCTCKLSNIRIGMAEGLWNFLASVAKRSNLMFSETLIRTMGLMSFFSGFHIYIHTQAYEITYMYTHATYKESIRLHPSHFHTHTYI